jgi:hypothetical protein
MLLPGLYSPQEHLSFEGIFRDQDTKELQIRFSHPNGNQLAIPLSRAMLAAMIQTLAALHGATPSNIDRMLETHRQDGFPFQDE